MYVPCGKIVDGESFSIVSDYLGTPTRAYDKDGVLIWNRELDIYGRCIKGNSDFVPFLYQGQYYDKETQLAYNRFRYYDPKMGMYISQDPIGLLGDMVLYGYVSDVNLWVDKMGLSKGSTALDKALGGTKYDNKMAHHLIPEKTWDKFETNLFSKIGLSGQRDVASNGLLMSDSKSAAKTHGNKLYHSTRHREYTKMVEKKLTSIQARLDAKVITPAQAKQQVESLQRSLRKKIENGKIKTKTPCGRLS